MPIYDYRCDHCGHVFSAVRAYTDEDTVDKCPNCGKKPRRIMTAPAIVFKGGGWYKTDSRGAPPTETSSSDKADKADKADKTDKPDKKTEATPAAAPAATTEKTEKKKEEKKPSAPKSEPTAS